jgi:hypothetical protein
VADFKKDLARGHAGELAFHKLKPELTRLDGRGADFVDADGKTYEIKTDSYESPNFFIERWSDVDKQKAGGPWQSAEKKIDFFCYSFPKMGITYIFSVTSLLEQLSKIKKPNIRRVLNKTWITVGWLVPIVSLNADEVIKHD